MDLGVYSLGLVVQGFCLVLNFSLYQGFRGVYEAFTWAFGLHVWFIGGLSVHLGFMGVTEFVLHWDPLSSC